MKTNKGEKLLAFGGAHLLAKEIQLNNPILAVGAGTMVMICTNCPPTAQRLWGLTQELKSELHLERHV